MIRKILEEFKKGKMTLEEAEKELRLFSILKVQDLGNLDIRREHRTGTPEVVFGEGKETPELLELVKNMVDKRGRCIVTRLSQDKIKALEETCGDYVISKNEHAGMVVVKKKGYRVSNTGGRVAILSAGTSDISRAEEAKIIAEEMGCKVYTFYDVGVAGIHRLFPALRKVIEKDVDVIIVAAGMEGALPSVVAGLVDVPVIGLPVSSGYGYGGRGKAALQAMLQSCSPGLAVVNVDNGLGAGVVASLIANRAAKFRE